MSAGVRNAIMSDKHNHEWEADDSCKFGSMEKVLEVKPTDVASTPSTPIVLYKG